MKRLLVSLVVLVMVFSSAAVFAQDDPELETYTSKDELLTLSYPAGWFLIPSDEELSFPGASFVNTEDGVDRFQGDMDIMSGDQYILVMLLPTDLLPMMGVEVEADASPVEFAQSIVNALFGIEEEDMEATEEPSMEATEEAGTMVGDVEEIELANDTVAAMATVADDESEGAVIIQKLGEDVIAVTLFATYPGEYTEELSNLAQAVASSITYTGTGADIMNLIMGGVETEMGTPEADEGDEMGASLDGEALVEERCTTCHTRERVDEQDKDEAGWTATVDRMISYGLELTDEERQAVIDYLVETH